MEVRFGKPDIDDNDLRAVAKTLRGGWLTHGPATKKFEDNFAEYIGVKHAIAMNSCTSALHLAIEAQGITGEVILPSFTFVASANAIMVAGAKPVFADIELDTRNINPYDIEAKITLNTEAIMPVHFAGHPCDMREIMRIADKHGLAVIEDAAETCGGKIGERMAGSYGVGCFSFFPTKNMTTGEGGMLTTNDSALAAKVRALTGHGLVKTPHEREGAEKPWLRIAKYAGYNFRMSDILGALGVEQLKKLEHMTARRRLLVGHMCARLREVEEIVCPVEREGYRHVHQIFTIRVRDIDRDLFVSRLRGRGVSAMVHFDPPLHHMAIYPDAELPVTDYVAESIVSLPLFTTMTVDQADYVVDSVKEVVAGWEGCDRI